VWVAVRWLVVVAVAALVGGCAAPDPAVTVPPPALHREVDQQAAERAVPTLADVGPGYRTSTFTPSAAAREEDAKLNDCLGRPPTVQHETARAFSPNFSAGDARQILAGVTFVDSTATAAADLAALADRGRAADCLRQSLLRQLGRTATVDVNPVEPAPGGPGVVAWRLRVVAGPTPVVLDLVSVVRGRAEVSLSFQDVNQPVAADLQDRLVQPAAAASSAAAASATR
jgi:hypothetical protein